MRDGGMVGGVGGVVICILARRWYGYLYFFFCI